MYASRLSAQALSIVLSGVVIALGLGCAMPRWTPNPSFVITKEEAAADLKRMQANPVEARRPVVFLAGIGDLSIFL